MHTKCCTINFFYFCDKNGNFDKVKLLPMDNLYTYSVDGRTIFCLCGVLFILVKNWIGLLWRIGLDCMFKFRWVWVALTFHLYYSAHSLQSYPSRLSSVRVVWRVVWWIGRVRATPHTFGSLHLCTRDRRINNQTDCRMRCGLKQHPQPLSQAKLCLSISLA